MLALLLGAALAADSTDLAPARLEASARPKKGALWVWVDGGPGEHLAPDAPATLALSGGGAAVTVKALGSELAGGLPLPDLSHAVTLSVDAVVCEDRGSHCRPASGVWSVSRDGRQVTLTRRASGAPPPERAHQPIPLDAAWATALADDRLVLIDFGAVWCPPCNLLAAEVLHDDADAAALAGFVLAEVDVDRRESWPTKDRYAVGGYPTLVVARPDGTEIDRLVGYPGEAAVLAWLAEVGARPALGELPEPATLGPDAAARLAARLATADRRDDARPYLAVAAAGGGDAGLLAQARLRVEGDPAAAVVAITAAARPGDWVWPALDLAPDHPPVAEALRAAVPRWLPAVGPVEGADVLYVAARLAPTAEQPGLYAAAAALLSHALSGDDALDRGHWVGLAHLYADSGQPEQAVALLTRAASVYPDEFTFHYALAGHLRDQGRLDAAQAAARTAVARAYGDNRLRAVGRLADVLADQGEPDAARALLEQTLADAVRPDPGARVRTFRYLDALERRRSALDTPAP